MRLATPLALVALATATAPATAEVTVRVLPASPGGVAQVELTARAAPLSEVLDRLSRQIGMKVVYEGASPRQLVTLTLHGRTPAETVLGLLEGTGVNFALQADATGARVETLLVAGSAPQAASASAAPAPARGRSVSPSGFRRPVPPPGSGPDVVEEDAPEDLEEDVEDDPAAPEEAAPVQPDPNAGNQPAGTMPPPPGNMPTPSFPVSPFAPQPYTPQPFPPVPPGAPVGAGSPQPQQQPPQEPGQQPPPD
jgi:hypothetical protein